jgi:hypothetical protein
MNNHADQMYNIICMGNIQGGDSGGRRTNEGWTKYYIEKLVPPNVNM